MSAPAAPSTEEVDALQASLAAEHAAVYLYGLLGARTSASAEPTLDDALRTAYGAHRDRRDELTSLVAALGATPVAAAVAYDASDGLDTAAGRSAAALTVEQRCAAVHATAVASTTAERRTAAIGWLSDTALRELGFGGRPEAFPGAPELA